MPGTRDGTLPGEGVFAPIVGAELERRLLAGSPFEGSSRALAVSRLVESVQEPGAGVRRLRELLAQRPDDLDLRRALLRSMARDPESRGAEQSIPVLREVARHHPEQVDFRFRWAAAALGSGDLPTARRLASSIGGDGESEAAFGSTPAFDPTPRQAARARYILGRAHRLEGNLEAATEHLAHNFELLQEHGGCPEMFRACDRGYRLHLFVVGDRQRFDRYERERRKSLGPDAILETLVEELEPDEVANNVDPFLALSDSLHIPNDPWLDL